MLTGQFMHRCRGSANRAVLLIEKAPPDCFANSRGIVYLSVAQESYRLSLRVLPHAQEISYFLCVCPQKQIQSPGSTLLPLEAFSTRHFSHSISPINVLYFISIVATIKVLMQDIKPDAVNAKSTVNATIPPAIPSPQRTAGRPHRLPGGHALCHQRHK